MEIGFSDALTAFDYGESFELLGTMFSPIDFLFYGFAIWEGFKFATVEGVEVIGSED